MATASCRTVSGLFVRSTPLKFGGTQCATVAGVKSFMGRLPWAGSEARRRQINWLPQANVPLVDASGKITSSWYKFFQEIANARLGGIDAPTVPEVIGTAAAVQTQVIAVQSTVQSVGSQVGAITDAVNTQTQVAKENNLDGSSQLQRLPSYKLEQLGLL